MARTSITGSSPGFVVDPNATARSDGRQIDWTNVSSDFIPDGLTKKRIPAGTIVAENADGKVIPRADVAAAFIAHPSDWAGTETSVGFLVSDAVEDARSAALSGYGMFIGGVFYRELLPDHGNASFADWVSEVVDAGYSVRLETFSDSRAA
jgi:hypothetical protein